MPPKTFNSIIGAAAEHGIGQQFPTYFQGLQALLLNSPPTRELS